MNLNVIASDVLNNSGVHPYQDAIIFFSEGSINNFGKVTPVYNEGLAVKLQLQNISQKALSHVMEGNQAENRQVVYINMSLSSIDRKEQKGGTFILFRSRWFLVTSFTDDFMEVGWSAAIITEQTVPPKGINL